MVYFVLIDEVYCVVDWYCYCCWFEVMVECVDVEVFCVWLWCVCVGYVVDDVVD